MCGRYTFSQAPDPKNVVQPEGMDIKLGPRFNIAPSQYCPVVPQGDAQHIHLFRWGLIPYWAKDAKIGYKMINARSETVFTKPAFRQPVRRSRCLVLADGFYEWKKLPGGKQPYWIGLKTGNPFSFAGISDRWKSPDGKTIESFSILTTEPNELTAEVHDRMPVILTPDTERIWLMPNSDEEELMELLRPFDADLMQAYPVSPSVGNVKNDSPHLTERYSPPQTLF